MSVSQKGQPRLDQFRWLRNLRKRNHESEGNLLSSDSMLVHEPRWCWGDAVFLEVLDSSHTQKLRTKLWPSLRLPYQALGSLCTNCFTWITLSPNSMCSRLLSHFKGEDTEAQRAHQGPQISLSITSTVSIILHCLTVRSSKQEFKL